MTLKETALWLSSKSIEDKIIFSELLLSDMTVMNRVIWDDPKSTDKTKVECLKWSNELAHRVWNTLFELKRGEDNNSDKSLIDNISFYGKQSEKFAGHLGTTINGTIERYNYFK
ncbi:hypothetical protein D1815_02305 [Aquimarina sp. AD1]|uniref:hypothetical protein n=1 Tax=Aquimarina TaxID=290174 RepID=UPI0003FAE32D|nr:MULTISPECIES: hypothetical protein [Aquimarina]AXT54639.1 hypothetical protein D1815_02305 [Aquimarina sp. AD1]RKN21706.1 hypothetical protein D7035_12445 [Aquimarina sp. AD1]